MYQKCPNCNGTGIETPEPGYTSVGGFRTCSVCKGEKIIDSTTGLPPSMNNQNLTPKAFDQHSDQIGKQFKNDFEK